MTQRFETFKRKINGQTVGVIGIGVSNLPLIDVLLQSGAIITARDQKDEAALGDIPRKLREQHVRLMLGDGYLEQLEEAWIFKTPGIRGDLPQIEQARMRGARVTSEMELLCDFCPAPIFGVTGSDGKTTTSTLIARLLEQAGHTCWLGGNIGTPLFAQLPRIQPHHKVVLELSSFQLQSMFPRPQVAVITNLSPNHLDWHKSMEEYIKAKTHLFAKQQPHQKLVFNAQNEITARMAQQSCAQKVPFGQHAVQGVHLEHDVICYRGTPVLPVETICLPGAHNVENYMAAIGAVWELVSIPDIQQVACTFGGVSHRLEFVGEWSGVNYYNDSIASSPTRAMAGLASFGRKVILIAGGYDKNIPFDTFGNAICDKASEVILLGQTAPAIRQAICHAPLYKTQPPLIHMVQNLAQAVRLAKQQAVPGDVVLLSPGCASFDQFRNFEERGNLFKQYVMELHEHE